MLRRFDKRMHLAEMLLALKLHGKQDVFRRRHPFSEDIAGTNAVLFSSHYSKVRKRKAYRNWLEAVPNQPCIFGRIASKNNNIFICLLEEQEVLNMEKGDEDLRNTIQDHRQVWKRYALEGLSSAFVIVLVSESLAIKQPSDDLKEVCRRLMELYMEIDGIADDTILPQREYVFLRRQTQNGNTQLLKFSTLPNIFCAQGDGRWWHDHRTPGGIMITSNALGHFVYSRFGKAQLDHASTIWALENAMRTISNAYRGPSSSRGSSSTHCPATFLIPAAEDEISPLRPTSDLFGLSADHYQGYFHTDHMIPSVYFQEAPNTKKLALYENLSFRYIYDPIADPEGHSQLMTGEEANWYDVKRSLDRLPAFVDPEKTPGLPRAMHDRLKRWLSEESNRRLRT